MPEQIELLIMQARAFYDAAEYVYRGYRLLPDAKPERLKGLALAVDQSLAAMNTAYGLRAEFEKK